MEKKVKIRGVWGKFSRGKPGESDFDQGNINCILVFHLPPNREGIDIRGAVFLTIQASGIITNVMVYVSL